VAVEAALAFWRAAVWLVPGRTWKRCFDVFSVDPSVSQPLGDRASAHEDGAQQTRVDASVAEVSEQQVIELNGDRWPGICGVGAALRVTGGGRCWRPRASGWLRTSGFGLHHQLRVREPSSEHA
jgi:hypothetical protein